ncbi:MAG: acylneuraminate cytidylyltransferase family protein [Bacteroidota bacterium]
MNHLVTICARGGSKGIPGKNIRALNGIPLIGYSIKVAQEFATKFKADIALSTDSMEIKQIAAEFGLSTDYIRPNEFAHDKAGKIGAIDHVLAYSEKQHQKTYDFVLDLDVTSPLRNLADLEQALEQLQANQDAYNLFSVNPAARNPYFNMVEDTGDGYVQLVKSGKLIKSRQEAPKVYDLNASFYFYRRSFFTSSQPGAITNKSLVYVMPHICFDLDEPIDFTIMELMLRENLLDFDL